MYTVVRVIDDTCEMKCGLILFYSTRPLGVISVAGHRLDLPYANAYANNDVTKLKHCRGSSFGSDK